MIDPSTDPQATDIHDRDVPQGKTAPQSGELKQVTCVVCKQAFPLSEEVLLTSPVKQYPSVNLITLRCPHCADTRPVYYDTPVMVRGRALLRKKAARANSKPGSWQAYQRERAKYGKLFDREQARMKKLLAEG